MKHQQIFVKNGMTRERTSKRKQWQDKLSSLINIVILSLSFSLIMAITSFSPPQVENQ